MRRLLIGLFSFLLFAGSAPAAPAPLPKVNRPGMHPPSVAQLRQLLTTRHGLSAQGIEQLGPNQWLVTGINMLAIKQAMPEPVTFPFLVEYKGTDRSGNMHLTVRSLRSKQVRPRVW